MSKLPGIKGACSNCKFCLIKETLGEATCRRAGSSSDYDHIGERLIYQTPRLSAEKHEELSKGLNYKYFYEYRIFMAKRGVETIEYLHNHVNPSWCPFRRTDEKGDLFRKRYPITYECLKG